LEVEKELMPKGPQGQKRPADVIGAAVMVARIATGEVIEKQVTKSGRTKSGKAGGVARAKKLSAKARADIAQRAAQKRWE
jgi:hypothetical protein